MHGRHRFAIAGTVGGAALLWVALVAGAIRPVPVMAQEGAGRKIWDGVYTDASGRAW